MFQSFKSCQGGMFFRVCYLVEKKNILINKYYIFCFYFSEGGERYEEIKKRILFMIIADNLAIRTPEKVGFRYLMQLLCPGFEISRTLMTSFMEKKALASFGLLKQELQQVQNLCVTLDGWKNADTLIHYLGCTGHYEKDGKIKKIILAFQELTERHTTLELSRNYDLIWKKWGIQKSQISLMLTDGAPNMVSSAKHNVGEAKHAVCNAHKMNTAVNRALEDDGEIAELLGRVRGIIGYVRGNRLCSDEWRKKEGKALVLSMPVRWNSALKMLQSFLESIKLLRDLLYDPPTSCKPPDMLTTEEVAALREIVPMLQQAEITTTKFSSEKQVVISEVLFEIASIKYAIKKCSATFHLSILFQKLLLGGIEELFGKDERCYRYAAAAILDPRYKMMFFVDGNNAGKAVTLINREVIEEAKRNGSAEQEQQLDMASGSTKKQSEAMVLHNDLYRQRRAERQKKKNNIDNSSTHKEFKTYLQEDEINAEANLNFDVIDYWTKRKTSSPNLAAVAIRHLSQLASTVPCERLFSRAKYVSEDDRSNNTPEHNEQLVQLQELDFEYWKVI